MICIIQLDDKKRIYRDLDSIPMVDEVIYTGNSLEGVTEHTNWYRVVSRVWMLDGESEIQVLLLVKRD